MAFQDLWNELIAYVPSLSPFLAQKFVNRAWREIRQMKSWSFLLEEGFLIVPDKITSGTVTVAQFSKNVTPDVDATAALDSAGSHPFLGERQFRIAPGNRVYNIDTWDGTTLVLKEEFQETGVTDSPYEVFRCYFMPPSDDFIRFVSIRDLVTNYHIRLNYTQEELNRVDPQRNTQGDPLYCASYKTDTSGIPIFELWPIPQVGRTYQVLYQKRGVDFSAGTDILPAVIPDHLVLDKALYQSYRWMEANKGIVDKKSMSTDWRYLAAESNRNFMEQLVKTMREDEDIFMQMMNFKESRSGFMTPIDANYAQNHVVDWW
jgi:hypothetical protein